MQLIDKRIDLIKMLPPGTIGAEIGVQRGYFSIEILNDAQVGKLFLVDAWKRLGESYVDDLVVGDQDENFRLTQQHIAGHLPGARVEIVRGMSVEVAVNWKGPRLDWVYIDADHSYSACHADLCAWSKLINPGGYIMGHDYEAGGHGIVYGVVPAVKDFCEHYGWEIYALTKDEVPSFCLKRISAA